MGKYFADVHEGPLSQLGKAPEVVQDTDEIKDMRESLSSITDRGLRYQALVDLAKALVFQLRYRSALIVLDKAVELAPERTEALRMRAIRRLYTLDIKGSTEDFLRLRKMGYGEVSYQLGLCYYLCGQYVKSMKEMSFCYGLSDNEMKMAAMYWESTAAIRCGQKASLIDLYSDDFDCGHHTAYKAGCALFAGRKSLEEIRDLALKEESDLEYSMLAYAESLRVPESERSRVLKDIVARDGFWIGFAYVAAWNDLNVERSV